MSEKLLVGQLAKEAGVSSDTVRFYEKHGLLPAPPRSGADYRLYDRDALRRVRFIRKAQTIGFSLAEIRRILRLSDRGDTPCDCVFAIAEATLEDTKQKISELTRLRDSLQSHLDQWKEMRPGNKVAAEFCGLIENTIP